MASSWGRSWGSAWGDSWGEVVAPPTPDVPPSVRMYSGGAYRVRDEDIDDLMRLLSPRKRRKKKIRAKELEAAAVAVMGLGEPAPAVKAIIADFVTPLIEGQRRQGETRLLVEALLNAAAKAAQAEADDIEQDDEDLIRVLFDA